MIAETILLLVLLAVMFWPGLYPKTAVQQAATPTTGGPSSPNSTPPVSCATTKDTYEVQGVSLAGVLENADRVTVETNYYACNDVKTGDMVLYNQLQGSPPVMKIVRGVPGDKLAIVKSGAVWNILVNGAILENSKGEVYGVEFPTMLDYYIRASKGVIPAGEYLLLGNLAVGSDDSTKFGFAGKTNVLGKVLR